MAVEVVRQRALAAERGFDPGDATSAGCRHCDHAAECPPGQALCSGPGTRGGSRSGPRSSAATAGSGFHQVDGDRGRAPAVLELAVAVGARPGATASTRSWSTMATRSRRWAPNSSGRRARARSGSMRSSSSRGRPRSARPGGPGPRPLVERDVPHRQRHDRRAAQVRQLTGLVLGQGPVAGHRPGPPRTAAAASPAATVRVPVTSGSCPARRPSPTWPARWGSSTTNGTPPPPAPPSRPRSRGRAGPRRTPPAAVRRGPPPPPGRPRPRPPGGPRGWRPRPVGREDHGQGHQHRR